MLIFKAAYLQNEVVGLTYNWQRHSDNIHEILGLDETKETKKLCLIRLGLNTDSLLH